MQQKAEDCLHFGLLEHSKVPELVVQGKLVFVAGSVGVCDLKIPINIEKATGQDVTRYGPDDDRCGGFVLRKQSI